MRRLLCCEHSLAAPTELWHRARRFSPIATADFLLCILCGVMKGDSLAGGAASSARL